MPTTLYLSRHGEAESTPASLFVGRSASPMTAEGRRQVERLALRLQSASLAAIYTSPSGRCVESAGIVAAACGLRTVTGAELAEVDYGAWEGLSGEEIAARAPAEYAAWVADPGTNRPGGGENAYAVAERAVPAVLRLAHEHAGQSILLVGHSGTNRIVLCHFLGIALGEYRRKLAQQPACLNCLAFEADGNVRVTLLNDTSHWADRISERDADKGR